MITFFRGPVLRGWRVRGLWCYIVRMTRMATLLCCLPLASACASTSSNRPLASPPGHSPVDSSLRILVDAPISYSVPEDGTERKIHTPMVRARVGNVETLLILDTGATDPIFTVAFADAIGVAYQQTGDGTDHADASVATFAGTSPLNLFIGDYQYTVSSPLFIEGPPPFEGWGVGGFLSPQLLHDHAWIEMDLQDNRLRIIRGSEPAVTQAVRSQHPELHGSGPLSRLREEGDAARLAIVEARLDNRDRIRVMFNTGGRHTELAPSTQPEPAAEGQVATGRGVSGEAVMGTHSTRSTVLQLGPTEVPLEAFVVREQGPAYEGQLGIDVLLGTVLLLRADSSTNAYWWH